MPTYGPFTRNQSFASAGYHNKTWFRQKPPYTLRLGYSADSAWVGEQNTRPGTDASSWGYTPSSLFPACQNRALAKARDRLNNDLGSNAAIAVTVAEWRSSLSMIENRAVQLYKFSRELRKGHIGAAISHLQLDPSELRTYQRLARGKRFGNAFLEFHFGWSPLVMDIANAVDVLQAPAPPTTVRGRGASTDTGNAGRTSGVCKVQCLTEVSVSSPNLYLANKLGFVNPATFAWELLPFSFLFDWLVPVGNFLSQWTDFVGLSLSNPATSTYWTVSERYQWVNPTGIIHKERMTMSRSQGISSYRLTPNRVTGLSASRGLTAVSLLLQSLK